MKSICRKWSHGKKIMGKFEVGHWMGAKKRGGGNADEKAKNGIKDFGPVPAIHITCNQQQFITI